MGEKEAVVLVDLCKAPDDIIVKILKRVPAKELLTACTKVSKQWHKVLSAKFFWKEKLEEDFRLPWRRLASQPVDFYKRMAIKRPFLRNFIRDSWDLTRRDQDCFQLDERWKKNGQIVWREDGNRIRCKEVRIEVPPEFSQQPEMGPALGGEPVLACLAAGHPSFGRKIVIRLADEGLTDELMDNYRPTIVVSELVANRSEYASRYYMHCSLSRDGHGPMRTEANYRTMRAYRQKKFQQGEAESWNLVRHKFKRYPAGMRYATLSCAVFGKIRAGFYGVKMACCSMMALCEGNNLETDGGEAVQRKDGNGT